MIAENKEDSRSKIDRGETGWDSDLYSSDGGEYDWDEEDDEDEYECEDCNSGCCEYGVKPSGQKYHNVRDNAGKFTKKM